MEAQPLINKYVCSQIIIFLFPVSAAMCVIDFIIIIKNYLSKNDDTKDDKERDDYQKGHAGSFS